MAWTRGPTIGRGSSAIVSLATVASSGELFAVKSAELSTSSLLQKEQSFISQLCSPYIVKYIGFDITVDNDKPMYNLLMEYVPGGNLSDLIKKQGGSLEESKIQFYAHQILEGLEYLHVNGVVHCDIKGQNVLIGKDGAKIADLGCARMVENGKAAKSMISGTPVFMAPEVARGEEQGFPADIWALGCTIIEMATGCSPWPEINDPVSALYRIGYSGDVPEFPTWLSKNATEFLSKCLSRDAEERWTAKQLLQHPFFHGMETNSREDAEFVRNSPTSVLDQGFWDFMEGYESSNESSHIVSSSNSPADRIKHLIGDAFSSSSNLPNWTQDEDWVTVRGIDPENPQLPLQNHNVDQDYEGLTSEDYTWFSITCVKELESPITNDDLLSNCFIDEINNTTSLAVRINLMIMSFENVEDEIVFTILDFGRKMTQILLEIILKFCISSIYLLTTFSNTSLVNLKSEQPLFSTDNLFFNSLYLLTAFSNTSSVNLKSEQPLFSTDKFFFFFFGFLFFLTVMAV